MIAQDTRCVVYTNHGHTWVFAGRHDMLLEVLREVGRTAYDPATPFDWVDAERTTRAVRAFWRGDVSGGTLSTQG